MFECVWVCASSEALGFAPCIISCCPRIWLCGVALIRKKTPQESSLASYHIDFVVTHFPFWRLQLAAAQQLIISWITFISVANTILGRQLFVCMWIHLRHLKPFEPAIRPLFLTVFVREKKDNPSCWNIHFGFLSGAFSASRLKTCFTFSTCAAAKTILLLLSSNTRCAACQSMSSGGVRSHAPCHVGQHRYCLLCHSRTHTRKILKRGNDSDIFVVRIQVLLLSCHARQKAGATCVEMKLSENRYRPARC